MFPAIKLVFRKTSYFSITHANSHCILPQINFHNLNLDKSDHFNAENLVNDSKQPVQNNEDFSTKKDSPYYIENSLRKVYPYYYHHATYCKGRWIKKKLIDLYLEEFTLYPKEFIERRILNGLLQINGNKVGLDYELKSGDLLTSYVHRHELPVLATSIKTLFEDENLLVVDKPPSIPVHPCGMYRLNSAIFLLAAERNCKELLVTHRLDRLTSGVLIFAKDKLKSRELHDQIASHTVEKEYLCRVEGNFPDGTVLCEKPLKQALHKMGASFVNVDGKPSVTEFRKLSFNGKSSVVLCRPKTGRTHQIRVHLQYLGHPIVNDPLYNSYAFGPNKGKHGELQKTREQLLSDLLVKHTSRAWQEGTDFDECLDYEKNVDRSLKLELNAKMDISTTDLFSSMDYGAIDENLLNTIYKKNPKRLTHQEYCYFCTKTLKDPKPSNLVMFLHAFRYKGQKWEFSTKIPKWAESDWDIM